LPTLASQRKSACKLSWDVRRHHLQTALLGIGDASSAWQKGGVKTAVQREQKRVAERQAQWVCERTLQNLAIGSFVKTQVRVV